MAGRGNLGLSKWANLPIYGLARFLSHVFGVAPRVHQGPRQVNVISYYRTQTKSVTIEFIGVLAHFRPP